MNLAQTLAAIAKPCRRRASHANPSIGGGAPAYTAPDGSLVVSGGPLEKPSTELRWSTKPVTATSSRGAVKATVDRRVSLPMFSSSFWAKPRWKPCTKG
jgi:hypothetical protein